MKPGIWLKEPLSGGGLKAVLCPYGAHLPQAEPPNGVKLIIVRSLFPLVCLCCSTLSKQRKNVISCVTVHDSPYSDSSSNNSPYAVQHRTGQNNGNSYDTKGVPETHCSGNPRTIIVPPLKTQASEVLVECDSLAPGKLHLFRQEN